MFTCAQQAQCHSLSACYQSLCTNMIDTAGGPKTASAAVLDQVLGCFAANNCPLTC